MKKDIHYLRELIHTHLQSKTFGDAGTELFSLLQNKTYEQHILNILEEEYDKSPDGGAYDPDRWEEVFKKIESRIEDPQANKPKTIRFRFRITLAIAALLMAISVISIILYNLGKPQDLTTEIKAANIKPGKNAATLTLASGKKIYLDEHGIGELAQEPGVRITKNQNGELIYTVINTNASDNTKYNTLSTANGETAKVILPDGTKVWLNAASSITYPSSFAAAPRREVSLIGEAYFEAKHDKQHPFSVKSSNQNVEVLGTSFNINGYADQPATLTTLLTGKVKIERNGTLKYLNPGQQAQNTLQSLKIIDDVDVSDVTAWKDGYFVFSDKLENIMADIAKWYDVKVIYENSPDLSVELQGRISRQKELREVLGLLEKYSGGVKFQVKDKTIIVKH